jgi:hypothetical protein
LIHQVRKTLPFGTAQGVVGPTATALSPANGPATRHSNGRRSQIPFSGKKKSAEFILRFFRNEI